MMENIIRDSQFSMSFPLVGLQKTSTLHGFLRFFSFIGRITRTIWIILREFSLQFRFDAFDVRGIEIYQDEIRDIDDYE